MDTTFEMVYPNLKAIDLGDGTYAVAVAFPASGVPAFTMADDVQLSWGTGNPSGIIWDTTDPNANMMKVELPAGDAVDVPAVMYGIGIKAVDLTFWNGITFPRIGVVDNDQDSWVAMGFNADNDAQVMIGGSAVLTMPAMTLSGTVTGAAQILSNLGMTYIGDTANTKSTLGLTINQGAADDEIISLQSSDVATGMTTLAETDVYGVSRKVNATAGGLQQVGYSSATVAVEYRGRGTTDNTTKSTAGNAYIQFVAQKKSGTSVGNVGANANLVAIIDHDTTAWLVDKEGDTWQNGGITTGGAAVVDYYRNQIDSTFTSGGASTRAVGTNFAGPITSHAGDTAFVVGVRCSIAMVLGVNTAYAAQMALEEPQITGAGTPAIGATLYIKNAPTEGTTANAAIYVASGDTVLAGGLTAGTTTVVNRAHFMFGGNFTSGGDSSASYKQRFQGVLTGFSGDTSYLTGTSYSNEITSQNAADVIADISQVRIGEPVITLQGGATCTVAASLYIVNAPTEGVTNAAIAIAGGDIKFLGSLDSAAIADQVAIGGYEIGAGNRVLAISQETAVAVEVDETKFSNKLQVRINGATYFIMLTTT